MLVFIPGGEGGFGPPVWTVSAVVIVCVPRVEVKDSTKSLMLLLIVWEVFAFGEVYLGCSLISSPFQFPTKRCLSPYPYESTVDVSALLELQFHQMPLDLNFSRRVRLLETS